MKRKLKLGLVSVLSCFALGFAIVGTLKTQQSFTVKAEETIEEVALPTHHSLYLRWEESKTDCSERICKSNTVEECEYYCQYRRNRCECV